MRRQPPPTIQTPELGLAALRTVLPDSLIAEALQEFGRQGQRRRKLPPTLIVWLLVGMGLFRSLSIGAVLGRLRDTIGSDVGWSPEDLPHPTAITQARDRLGWETVRLIFRRLASLLSDRYREAMTWRGLPVLIPDGTSFLAPDTEQNEEAFGRPGANRGGKSGFPQLRGVLLVSAWTHVVVDAVLGPYRTGELTLVEQLLGRLKAGSLLVMDRAYYSFKWLAQLQAAHTCFVVRVKKGGRALKPRKRKRLGPNESRAVLPCPKYLRARCPWLPGEIKVRLVTYRVGRGTTVTLATNLLDTEAYPSAEIAALYADRWEVELSYRELKITMAKEKVVFRCKTPERVVQEAYGLLVAYNCVRGLMAEAAGMTECRPIDLSFKQCLEEIRWYLRIFGYLGDRVDDYDLLAKLALRRLPARRKGRRCPRAVKIKMSNYERLRPGDRTATRRGKRRAG